MSTAPAPYPVIDAGNPFYRNGSNKVYDASGSWRRYGHYTAVRITDDYLEAATVSWNGAGSLCDHGSASTCTADPDCRWVAAEEACRATTEICMPGVVTLPCDPSAGACDDSNKDGGWAVKVRLSDRHVLQQVQRFPHFFCPGF